MDDLLTHRLRLRQARADDLEAVHDLLSYLSAMRYWSTSPHVDIEQSRTWLERMIARSADTGCDFVVEFEGRVIGKAGCHEPPEIGYIFHPEVWGRGFASEALAAVIPRIFAACSFDTLRADVDPRNEASLKLLARLGFREVGRAKRTWLVGDEWCDSVYLALSRTTKSLSNHGQDRRGGVDHCSAMTEPAPPLELTADPLDRARLQIDGHLFEPLTLVQFAAIAGLSTYHFSRQFGARFGISPMAYVRARRLAAAADRMFDDPPPPLIDLGAFDCGFDSQEGFTRAFKRAFGVSPGRYRRQGAQIHCEETLTMNQAPSPRINLTQAPEPIRKDALRIAGFAGLFNDANKAGIPLLWERLVPALPISGQAGEETYGVCAEAPGGEPGSMRYVAGVALSPGAAAPPGMDVIELAAQHYLVFRQIMDGGEVQPQMQAAAREIWGERLPKSGHRLVQAPDLEFYPADSTPDQPGAWVEWWAPVEG